MKNIFDLTNTEGLPRQLVEALSKPRVKKEIRYLLELFDIKNNLTTNEIMVGLYRKFSLFTTKKWVISTTYNLTKKGFLKKISKGKYRKLKGASK